MKVLDAASDSLGVRRVFGDPIEKDGVTVIPVASVMGGGGGGEGESVEGEGSGSGGGFGIVARPIGVYVIREDCVEWRPTFDVARILMASLALAALATLTVGDIVKRRRR